MNIPDKYQDSKIMQEMLHKARTIAVVGLSDKPERSSYGVAEYLSKHYEIVPVNPMIKEVLGKQSYSSLTDIPKNIKIDIVNIFRRSEEVAAIVDEAIAIKAPYIFMQQGVVDLESAKRAEAHGIKVIMDACLAVAHSTLGKRH